MKYLISILLFSVQLHADSGEVLGGSLTYHIFNSNGIASRYSNKLSSDGKLIDNALLGYRQVHVEGVYYTSKVLFTGTNSVAEPILGVAGSTGLIIDDARVGFIAGAYMQDNDKFFERGITPLTLIPSNGWAPAPILGLELTKTFTLSKSSYILINGLVSITILNATVGVGWTLD